MKDYTGQKFGRLTAIELDHTQRKHSYWKFKCECGSDLVLRVDTVVSGNTKSCGCYNREAHRVQKLTHGFSKQKVYHVFYAMKSRCYDPSNVAFEYYGGRGIKICDEWLRSPSSFCEWAYANGYSNGLTIDRIDVNGDYSPDNCRWVSRKTQNENTRRNTWLTYNGETMILRDWCQRFNVNMATACSRIKRGLSFEQVFNIDKV